MKRDVGALQRRGHDESRDRCAQVLAARFHNPIHSEHLKSCWRAGGFDTMLAYSATTTVDNARVIHHVDAAWNPAWLGPYRLEQTAAGMRRSLARRQAA
jgi:hypothetical protein